MSALSDEGMWLLNDPPRELLKTRYGFELSDDWLKRAMHASVRLNSGGSLYLTRPTLWHYTQTPEELRWRAGELFDLVAEGTLDVRTDKTWPLEEVQDAHRYLEARGTQGKVLLRP